MRGSAVYALVGAVLLWGVNRDSLVTNSAPIDGPIIIYVRKQTD